VEHTFAIGQSPLEPVTLRPGQPVEITLTFAQPGKYTFYTTTPSSLNFWRVRGTLEVTGGDAIPAAEPPLYVRLGLDLDAEHESEGEMSPGWTRQPSARRGAALQAQIPSAFLTSAYYLSHSPMEAYEELRGESTLKALSSDDLWDLVATLWQRQASQAALDEGKQLYEVNCAACHGVSGAGDGQFADEMKALAEKNQAEHGLQAPTDFTNPEHLLEAKPAILQGKLLRGGMGTGMPMWGGIFTDEQTWEVVAYLYTFQFDDSQ
jgi:mono/diheme cytochrome c family protein